MSRKEKQNTLIGNFSLSLSPNSPPFPHIFFGEFIQNAEIKNKKLMSVIKQSCVWCILCVDKVKNWMDVGWGQWKEVFITNWHQSWRYKWKERKMSLFTRLHHFLSIYIHYILWKAYKIFSPTYECLILPEKNE